MNFLKKVFARTIYMTMAEQNKIIYRFRCGNTRQNARKNPDYFDDRSLGIVAAFLAYAKFWIVLLLKKLIYIGVIAYIPYNIMSLIVGRGAYPYESTMAYIFIIMSVLFGSLVNPWMYRLDANEKKFLAILDEKYYFFNRLAMRAASDAVSFALALRIFQVGFWQYGLWISIAAALLRPMGEVIAYAIRQKTPLGKRGHSSFMGICMAFAVIFAYIMPVINKSIGRGTNFYYGMFFAIMCIVIFAVSLLLFITAVDFKEVTKAVFKE